MPRHRTMRAVLDWSYGLLSQDEQRFFRALGIFAGGFNADAAAAVAVDAATTGADAINRLADLVAKSLVVADVSSTRPRFRMLDTTRAYAIEQLDANGERERLAHPHANTTAISLSAPRPHRKCGLRLSGSPNTGPKSTICAQGSTGLFRQAAMHR
jgi:predicted ATPase